MKSLQSGSEPQIGDLRHRMMLQSPVRAEDGGGGADVTWTLAAEIWAALLPAAGSESLEADRLSGRVSHEIWLRHRADITPEMRFVLGPRAYDIRAVLDVNGRRRWLRCLAEEKDL